MEHIKSNIIKTIKEKSITKQVVYDHTYEAFKMLKQEVQGIVVNINEILDSCDERVKLSYRDRGDFEFELKVAGDILVFNMHTNIFEFDANHTIWKSSYLKKDSMASYCGVINVYNFLADSFKYDRLDDLGYLIARLFVNKDQYFLVEGKHQIGFLHNTFLDSKLSQEEIRGFAMAAIEYSLEFDLLVPPYKHVEEVSVAQMNDHINKSKAGTGKRMGFQFYKDKKDIV
jgi:hypothetical protein